MKGAPSDLVELSDVDEEPAPVAEVAPSPHGAPVPEVSEGSEPMPEFEESEAMDHLLAGTFASDLDAMPRQMVVDSDDDHPVTYETFIEKARLCWQDFDEAVNMATAWCYELNQSKYGAQLSAEISDWLQAIAIAKRELDIPPAPERSNWKAQLQQVEFNANRLMERYAAFKELMDYETGVPGSQNMQ